MRRAGPGGRRRGSKGFREVHRARTWRARASRSAPEPSSQSRRRPPCHMNSTWRRRRGQRNGIAQPAVEVPEKVTNISVLTPGSPTYIVDSLHGFCFPRSRHKFLGVTTSVVPAGEGRGQHAHSRGGSIGCMRRDVLCGLLEQSPACLSKAGAPPRRRTPFRHVSICRHAPLLCAVSRT